MFSVPADPALRVEVVVVVGGPELHVPSLTVKIFSNKMVSFLWLCLPSSLSELRESGHCSQDSMQEDSFVSSTGPDQFSEMAMFSGSDSETHGAPTPSQDQPPESALSGSESPLTSPEPPPSEENNHKHSPSKDFSAPSGLDMLQPTRKPVEEEVRPVAVVENADPVREAEMSAQQGTRRSASVLSRKLSSESLPVSSLRTDTLSNTPQAFSGF